MGSTLEELIEDQIKQNTEARNTFWVLACALAIIIGVTFALGLRNGGDWVAVGVFVLFLLLGLHAEYLRRRYVSVRPRSRR